MSGLAISDKSATLSCQNGYARCQRWPCAAVLAALACVFVVRVVSAVESPTGEKVYQQKCASCHGTAGEGTSKNYPEPLVGDLSIGELTRYIEKTMPEDKPGTCVGEEAARVAEFIHGAFYSPTAQARNKPARIELSRLTVRQYRNAVADLIGSFRQAAKPDGQQGLRGEYFKSRRQNGKDRAIERIDPVVAFNFEDKSPDAEKMEPHEFSIRWEGSVQAPETGEYEFIVRTDQSMRLWVNDLSTPLIDAYVRSGSGTEYSQSLFLLGGRSYSLKLEFSKAKQGVNDKKAKEKPPAQAMISLEWKRAHRVAEVIPARQLSPGRFPETFVVTAPFPPDDRSIGYERGTTISKEWDQATTDAAIEVAAYVLAHLAELSGVKGDAGDREPRLREFCLKFAERAFRRPLTDEQRQLYIDQQFTEAGDPTAAVKRVVLLALKSPRFLYREVGETSDAYDVASRMAFGLWDSLPDQALLDAAAKGQLVTREQVVSHAERMVNDSRTRSKLRDFLMQWLKVEHVPDVAKDSATFPEFSATIASDLRTSLELMLDELIASDAADFRQLLLAESLQLNGRLAKFYGVDLPEEAAFQKVELDSGERAGVLSHPYLMTGFAYSATSSPIHRGVFIARSVLGRSLRPPPEAVVPLAPDLHADLTTRERVALQTKPETCMACHRLINPLGFTLEHFDAVGRFRKDEQGKPVDTKGAYRTRTGELATFAGVRDLAQYLAASEETHAAFVQQLFHNVVKQPVRAYGSETHAKLRQAFATGDFSIRKLMVEIIATSALTSSTPNPQTAVRPQ
ncbi:MAG: DUF1592 domain-containing protein [Planctomycetota bacterium]